MTRAGDLARRTDGLIRSARTFPTDRVPETSIRGDTRPVLPLTRKVWMFVFPFSNYIYKKKKGLEKKSKERTESPMGTERFRREIRKRRIVHARRRPFWQKQSPRAREISSRKLKAATKPFPHPPPTSERPRGVVSDTCTRRLNRNTAARWRWGGGAEGNRRET